MAESYVFIPSGRRPMGNRLGLVFGSGCPLLVWEWPDGDWCYLDQLWHWQWRHKRGGCIVPWYAGL